MGPTRRRTHVVDSPRPRLQAVRQAMPLLDCKRSCFTNARVPTRSNRKIAVHWHEPSRSPLRERSPHRGLCLFSVASAPAPYPRYSLRPKSPPRTIATVRIDAGSSDASLSAQQSQENGTQLLSLHRIDLPTGLNAFDCPRRTGKDVREAHRSPQEAGIRQHFPHV